jgi:hypothetical protein
MQSDFVFKKGKFKACAPFPWTGEHDPTPKDCICSEEVGDANGLNYGLYEPTDGQLAFWIVEFRTASRTCRITCASWPDLIELLAKLAPIVQASRSKGTYATTSDHG